MIQEKKNRAITYGGAGLAAQIAGLAMMNLAVTASMYAFGQGLAFMGSILLLLGCIFLAQAKGYHSLLGALGLAWLAGVLVLLVLPDKSVRDGAAGPPPPPPVG